MKRKESIKDSQRWKETQQTAVLQKTKEKTKNRDMDNGIPGLKMSISRNTHWAISKPDVGEKESVE
jgi:hypothetical protein